MTDQNTTIKSINPRNSLLEIDEFDEIQTTLSHAHAMLTMIYGPGFESFNTYSDEIRENYIWACAEKVGKALKVMDKAITDINANKE